MSTDDLPLVIDLSATVELVVPFHDADPAGVAWHGNYFRYFDDARCALLADLGYDYRQMSESGYYWPIVKAEVKYIRPLPYGSSVTVVARMLEWEYRLKIGYEILDAQKVLVTTAHTIQVAVSMVTGEMSVGAPEPLRERLRAFLARQGGNA